MIPRILLGCLPYGSSGLLEGLLGSAGLFLGVGASGDGDCPFVVVDRVVFVCVVVLGCGGSWLGSETSSSPHRAVPAWDCSSAPTGPSARTHAAPNVPANATAIQNDRIVFKSVQTSVFPCRALPALLF